MAPQVYWRPKQRELPSLRRGWRTPDPSPTRDAGAGEPILELCIVEDTPVKDDDGSSPRGRALTESTHCPSRTPSPWQGWLGDENLTPGVQSTQRVSYSKPNEMPRVQAKDVAGDLADKESSDQFCGVVGSVGSMGHPHSCAIACKFVKKKSGCKDGANCLRCHLCVWTRAVGRRAAEQPEKLG